ncbi:flotillin family protein [bacterium 210917-DFI.7.65]|uniref:flotillin family protein n=1 Tax=Ruthenibacterium lactatiformans TaxID=1550024 RepID=UPI002A4284BB|nr:flotillin family protein [bacterium 210917-DFI.7.65]
MIELLNGPVIKTLLILIVALIVIVFVVLKTWKKVPNDHAAVIVGLGKPKVVTGGGVFLIPLLQRMDVITLETLSLDVNIQNVKTSLGVPINADGYVILKVKADETNILTAMQMFYCNDENRTKNKIVEQVQSLCEGKLREIVSTMTVEEIYDDREKFSASVTEIASKALSEIGLELKSFTINDITDNDDYIVSLGRAQIAKVKAEASIAEAEANKTQQIQTAEARKLGEQARLAAETAIAESEKDKELKLQAFRKEQETKRAESDAAYQIQENITSKDVTSTEMDASVLREQRAKEVTEAQIQVQIAAEQKNIELAQKRAERKAAELQETVVKPAEAAQRETELRAEAAKIQAIKEAQAEAEAKKLDAEAEAAMISQRGQAEAEAIAARGQAEAEAIRAKGLAEAEALEKKAEALAKMNEAGKLQMVMDILPAFAQAIAEPMSKIGNVTVIGGGESGSGVDAMTRSAVSSLKAVTEAVKDTVGFDLTKVMEAQTIDAKTRRDVTLNGGGAIDVQLNQTGTPAPVPPAPPATPEPPAAQ